MPTFYTRNGSKINHPEKYAKTGAPMFCSNRRTDKQNINRPTAIYELQCQHNKTYVGKTTNIRRRMQQHASGNGARVTQKFKPINYKVVDIVPGFLSSQVEQKHTKKCVDERGYSNVRGGKWVNSKTLHKPVKGEEQGFVESLPSSDPDEKVIVRLMALGFPRDYVVSILVSCDNNEILAADLLFD